MILETVQASYVITATDDLLSTMLLAHTTENDIDKDIPLKWWRALLTCCSYLLFFTDIPRSGLGFSALESNYHSITESLFTDFGPYTYPIIEINRSSNGSIASSTPQAKVWSYKFDTCSVGLRTVATYLNVSEWDPCIFYKSECNSTMIDAEPLFIMLDSVVDTLKATPPQSWRVHYRFSDNINDKVSFGALLETDLRTVRSNYFSSNMEICNPGSPLQPLFCEQSWTSFGNFGVEGMETIFLDIQSRLHQYTSAIDPSTQVVDISVIDGIDDLRVWGGGLSNAYLSPFDVNTILRVQNCTDTMKLNCSTVYLIDYRYEGGLGRTNTLRWYKLALWLRLVGQAYNIGRVLALLIGCYYGRCWEDKHHSSSFRTKMWYTLTTSLRIPAQVVIYGSWFPVMLFSFAHYIDSPYLYLIFFLNLATVNGTFYTSMAQIYNTSILMTCHMRNVWVLSLLSKIIIFVIDNHQPQFILGFRGYLLPFISFISILFEIRLIAFRDTNILSITSAALSYDTQQIREYETMAVNFRYWGIYSDLKNLFQAACVVYIIFGCIFRTHFRFRTRVPYSIFLHCNHSVFSTSWSAISCSDSTKVFCIVHLTKEQRSKYALMHVTWMTDPIQYLSLLWTRPVVYAYRIKATQEIFHHGLPLNELLSTDSQLEDAIEFVQERIISSVPAMGSQDENDIDRDVPLTWQRVLLAFVSYMLFFTDIARSGFGFNTLPSEFHGITDSFYAYFGPYNYPIMAINRYTNGSIIGSIPEAKSWSYKFDTCSVGLRTVVTKLNVSGDPCLLFQSECSNAMIEPETLFPMLDNVVDALKVASNPIWRVNYYYSDIINDILVLESFKNRASRTVRGHYLNKSVDVCHPLYLDRPYFCDQPWIDFKKLGRSSLNRISDEILAIYSSIESQIDPTSQLVEMILLEGIDDLRTWGGGFQDSKASLFDIITLLRVQNCTDHLKTNCSTIYISDYRYEGGFGQSGTMAYYGINFTLRLVGQAYNIIRVVALFIGIKLWSAFKTFLRIPSQVVIYGSWFPVLLFAIAHLIDSPLLYYCIFLDLGSINGSFKFNPNGLYNLWYLLTCHMRNVWLLSLVTKNILYTIDIRVFQAILGFRGYLLPFVSFLTIFCEIRLLSLRRTDILYIFPAVLSDKTSLIRELETIPNNHRFWGVFSDSKNLLLSWCIVYTIFGGILRRQLSFHTTVPFTLLRHCNRTVFSTSWSSIVQENSTILTKVYSQGQLTTHQKSQFVLMHVTWMTDPIQYLSLRWKQPVVFIYRVKRTQEVFYHALPFRELLRMDRQLVTIALLSYLLFFTDIPRSGLGFKSIPPEYIPMTETFFSDFGPYDYPIVALNKTLDGTIVGHQAKVWSYKYDTCSVGLRTVATYFNVSGWDPCLVLNSKCNHTMIDPGPLFIMLDNTVSKLQHIQAYSWRVNYFYSDIVNDMFALISFQGRNWRTVRSHYIATPIDICHPNYPTRPNFCEELWTDFKPLDITDMDRIMSDIQLKFEFHSNSIDHRTQRVDMAILEAIDDQRIWGGGFAKTYGGYFDVVTVLRVQNCSNFAKTNCTTTLLADYRYEGNMGRTNTKTYYGVAHWLRIIGQAYNIARTLTLFVGCYYARSSEDKYINSNVRTKLWLALKTQLRIPSQVVIYGSWFPVSLFVIAHLIDSPLAYYCIFMDLGMLNGTFTITVSQLYNFWVLLMCHMRNVWVLSLATKFVLFWIDNKKSQSILGYRGYLLPCVSFLTIFFEIRHASLRKTDLIYLSPAVHSVDVMLTRELHTLPNNYRYWGVYSDIKNLFLAWCFTYFIFGGILRFQLSFYTTVPYTILRHCNRSMFSTSWNSMVPAKLSHLTKVHSQAYLTTPRHSLNALMHITWMTDPLQYLCLLWTKPVIFVYRIKTTDEIIHHALPLRELLRMDAELGDTVEFIGEAFLHELTITYWSCINMIQPIEDKLNDSTPLSWKRVSLSLISYLLFFTDIPRSGFGFTSITSGYKSITESIYSNFGPYNYPIVEMTRLSNGTVVGSIPEAKVWSYKYDTCSVGLRTVVTQFNTQGWNRCLLYKNDCDSSTINLAQLFIMLDNVVTSIEIEKINSWRVNFYYTDIIDDIFSFGVFKERDYRTIQTTYLRNTSNLCASNNTPRPLFCNQLWADFGAQGDDISRLSNHIQFKFDEMAMLIDTSTQILDLAIIEGVDDLRHWTGGLSKVHSSAFDFVTLLRVRNCTSESNCTTVSLHDYRYEGGIGMSNTFRWYGLTHFLRFIGQAYNIGRTISLIVGCYFARDFDNYYDSKPFSRRGWLVLRMFLHIPAQVVIYGSWFPVLFFVLAHLIDSPFLYFIIFMEFYTINGFFDFSVRQLYNIAVQLTCNMRNVWVLTLIIKTFFTIFDTSSTLSLMGVRGYLVSFVSFTSILLEIRLISVRNTDFHHITNFSPSSTIQMIRGLQTIPSNYRFFGVYTDVKDLCFVFIIVFLVFRFVFQQPVAFSTTVPCTLRRYCRRNMFSTSWHSSSKWLKVHSSDESAHALMNIVWMTDPIEYLTLLWLQPVVYIGFGFRSLPTDYHRATESLFMNFGPYDYPVAEVNRTLNGSVVGSGANVWSYKYDTCSVGVRTVARELNVSGWNECFTYANECTSTFIESEELFPMLDNTVAAIQANRLQTWRVLYYFVDIVNDLFAFGFFKERDWRTVRTHYLDKPEDLCHPMHKSQPYFCLQHWSDFGAVGGSPYRIMDNIQSTMILYINQLDMSLHIVDAAIIEAIDDLRPWGGGLTEGSLSAFDVITLYRIQNCTDTTKLECSTVFVADYRYEGGIGGTNTLMYYGTTSWLRFIGQIYNICRVIALLIGCYYARSNEDRYLSASKWIKIKCMVTTWLRIPAQVVIYGSWFPVILFVLGHWIDAPFLYLVIYLDLATINGSINMSFDRIYNLSVLLTCHMRNVWVLSIITKGIIQTLDLRLPQSILGFRAYLLPFVSFSSILFEMRLVQIRNTALIHVMPIVPSESTALVREFASVPSNCRYWGIYSDIKNLGIAFFTIYIISKTLINQQLSFYTSVPFTLKKYCHRTMLSTSWNTIMYDKPAYHARIHPIIHLSSRRKSRFILMHITWMTDPIQHLTLLWLQPVVFTYRIKSTQEIIYHAIPLRKLVQLDKRLHDTVDNLGEILLMDLSWQERILCH
ncbi:hypothetical protein THRCLA_21889 [Thraustotheca clavata]|uniref:Uncharacterized protein n=1 Tax=Thraustotheca clavata TaxID=74557 RepID=A0A1V9ZK80_9STRA|nr:hypothetical protein THRCLA_21889 [Thraustotheca clavata]